VFIDIDRIRAGQKFQEVLEQRLAECKVMVAVIGPQWLNARGDDGRRRLEDPTDWVHLEIVHALARKITVIPVTVGGANLPKKGDLPEELRPLLDYHAVAITTNGFRSEMAGLVNDIRAIPGRSSWWPRIAAGFAAAMVAISRRWLVILLSATILGGAYLLVESFRPKPPATTTAQFRFRYSGWYQTTTSGMRQINFGPITPPPGTCMLQLIPSEGGVLTNFRVDIEQLNSQGGACASGTIVMGPSMSLDGGSVSTVCPLGPQLRAGLMLTPRNGPFTGFQGWIEPKKDCQ
jgi:TIR domain